MADNEQRGFEDLECYKLALSVVREAYQVARRLPSEEKYNLADDTVRLLAGELPKQRELCHNALRALNGYIRYVRGQRQGHQEYGDRALHEDSPDYTLSPEPPINDEPTSSPID